MVVKVVVAVDELRTVVFCVMLVTMRLPPDAPAADDTPLCFRKEGSDSYINTNC